MENRQNLIRFAIEALRQLPRARTYAVNDSAKTDLACLAAAVRQDRERRNLTDDDEPKISVSMVVLLEQLVKAGCNLQQERPEGGEPKPLPIPWIDPVTKQLLPPPTDLKGKMLLRKYDPALADHYDAMERDPYGYIQSLREDEAKRKALASVPYSETEHLANPWRIGSRKLQDELVRRGPPELVRFYQAEARDVEIPLFGANRNLTVLGKVSHDSDTWEIVKAAEKIADSWREQDKAAANEARVAAEATLRRLETT
jgi:hypothetical protein